MDPIERRAKVQGQGAERIAHAARHLFRQPFVPLPHFLGRIPIGPRLLAAYLFRTGPCETFTSDGNRVGVGASTFEHIIKFARGRIDDDGCRRKTVWKGDLGWCLRLDLRSRPAIFDGYGRVLVSARLSLARNRLSRSGRPLVPSLGRRQSEKILSPLKKGLRLACPVQ